MTMSKAALAAIFAGGAAMLAGTIPAQAQGLRVRERDQQRQQQQQQGSCQLGGEGQRQFRLSAAECTAVAPLLTAFSARDWAAARAALPAAQAAADSADAKYLIGQVMLQIGIGTNDNALQAQAVDALIASGGAQQSEMRALYQHQLRFATEAGNTAKAQQAQAQLDALIPPNDPSVVLRQAQARIAANDFAGAIPLFQQAMERATAAGQPVPPEWRRALAGAAYRANDANTMRYMREWLTAEPSPAAWHDTLAIFAGQGANTGLKLDIYRLMRGAGAMTSEHDYLEYADAAQTARAYGEVAAVLQEGISRNLITTNAAYARERLAEATRRTSALQSIIAQERQAALAGSDAQHAINIGDAHYGAGQYAQAAELYRAAAQKGADAATINTRIGAALALAGQRAEAETAFRAVGPGPRAELAQLWLLWLASRT